MRRALVLVLVACGSKAAPSTAPSHVPAPAKTEVAPSKPDAAPAPAATVDVEARLEDAMKAYDRADYERARAFALEVVSVDELNVRALRVLVSVACLLGDSQEAKLRYLGLPDADRAQMRTRCARYGVVLD
jgi:hypothetical protein